MMSILQGVDFWSSAIFDENVTEIKNHFKDI